jgi:hypothetical protein
MCFLCGSQKMSVVTSCQEAVYMQSTQRLFCENEKGTRVTECVI